MGRKIKINEHQLKLISGVINETSANVRLKNKIFNFIKADYEAVGGVKKIANEFHGTGVIQKKIDGENITPLALAEYLEHKFPGLTKKEIKDSIEGWYFDDFDSETGMRKKK